MEKILTPLQYSRQKRNEAILRSYNESFVDGSSITEWCRKIAKKHKCSCSTVYNLVLKEGK